MATVSKKLCRHCLLLEGKTDQLTSNAWFNKQASRLYRNLMDDDREELIVQTTTSEVMTQRRSEKKGQKDNSE